MLSGNKDLWKHTLMIIALVLLICIAGVINFGGATAVKLLTQMLATQTAVQGKVSYERIDAGWSGDVEVHSLKWVAPNGDKLAEVPLVTLSVNFFDTLIKGGGMATISNVVLNRPHFYGDFDNVKGFDLLKSVNFVGEPQLPGYKTEKPLDPTGFRGLIEIKDGTLDLKINGKPMQFTKLGMQGVFKQYPVMKFALLAKSGDTDVVLNLVKEGKATRVNGEVKKAKATDLMYMFPNLKNVIVKDGLVPTANITAETKGDNWTVYVAGDLKGLKGQAFDMNITGGEAKFVASREEIKIEKMQLLLNEMPVAITGSIKTAVGTPQPASYQVSFSAPKFQLTALSKGLELEDPLAAQGSLTGTILEPKLEGSFTSNKLKVSPLVINGVAGKFKVENGSLHLGDALGSSFGGQVRVNGSVALAKGDFKLQLEGIDIDATQLTNKEVEGKLQLNAVVEGTNQAATAQTQGEFSIEDGRFRGDGMGYLRGKLNQTKGVFSTEGVRMHKGFKYFDAKVTLTPEKQIRVMLPNDEKKAAKEKEKQTKQNNKTVN